MASFEKGTKMIWSDHLRLRYWLLRAGITASLLTPGISAPVWQERSYSDEMTSQTVQTATTRSTNEVTFEFPYGGPQFGSLTIRKHPRNGNSIMLWLEKAQFLCRNDGCEVLVRFDKGAPHKYNAVAPSDHSTNALFFEDYDSFLSELTAAKEVRIEAEFYRDGNRVLTFDVTHVPSLFTPPRIVTKPTSIGEWMKRILAKINDRIVVPRDVTGNPEVRVAVVLLPSGNISSVVLQQSSGNEDYDTAVARAIEAAQPLPVPAETALFQKNFRELNLIFRPKD
jgi:TonB family protein